MGLVTPGLGLILWQVLTLLSIISFVVAWIMILASSKLDAAQKVVWLLGTLFLPLIGALIFFIKFPSLSKVKHQG